MCHSIYTTFWYQNRLAVSKLILYIITETLIREFLNTKIISLFNI